MCTFGHIYLKIGMKKKSNNLKQTVSYTFLKYLMKYYEPLVVLTMTEI